MLVDGKREGTLRSRFIPATRLVPEPVTAAAHNRYRVRPRNAKRRRKARPGVKAMSRRTAVRPPQNADDIGEGRRTEVKEAERSHVTLVSGDPPMLKLEINLYSWERGDSEIEITLPHGSELSDLLDWALPEQRLVICGNLRARIQDELAEVWDILQEP